MLKGCYFLDIFSGTGGVSARLRTDGYVSREIELKKGFNFLDKRLLKIFSRTSWTARSSGP